MVGLIRTTFLRFPSSELAQQPCNFRMFYRFEKMERIWRLERLEDFASAKVTALEWRPDGRAIAIAYSAEDAPFMRLMTEEGPVELTDEIGLPATVKGKISRFLEGILIEHV